jgi:hypothetical protein
MHIEAGILHWFSSDLGRKDLEIFILWLIGFKLWNWETQN